jgi:tryptophanyl-tRNA synthetase
MRYGDLKKQVAEMTISHLEPFQQRYREMMSDPAYIPGVLREGAARVGPIANSTVDLVKRRMGLYVGQTSGSTRVLQDPPSGSGVKLN